MIKKFGAFTQGLMGARIVERGRVKNKNSRKSLRTAKSGTLVQGAGRTLLKVRGKYHTSERTSVCCAKK
jgi:hypothetical protein